MERRRFVPVCLTMLSLLFPLNSLAGTRSYFCGFTLQASPSGMTKQSKPFELRFVVDADTEKSYLIGNAGSAEVKAIPNSGGISFVEITNSGNVMVTAIAKNGDAVHSRSGIFGQTVIPTQQYGSCTHQ